jgi:uncharacterized integral membrane protein
MMPPTISFNIDLASSVNAPWDTKTGSTLHKLLTYHQQLEGTRDLRTLWSPPVSLNHIYFKETFCFKQLHVVIVASHGAI